MERVLLVLIATLGIIHHVHAQPPSQQGFISLDCGLSASEVSPYIESQNGIRYSSDATFIKSGVPGGIEANQENGFSKPVITLRYFPDGIRNCYNLEVEKGRNHLIRARFAYGNYDGLNIAPNFDLYLGPNLWTTIDLKDRVNGTRAEILHIPTSNSLQICLVKTGPTIPMISALEIRPMGYDSYITKSGSLQLYFRIYLSESEEHIKYPDDVYDRRWTPYFKKEWTLVSTTSDVGNNNSYDPPKATLATAAIPTNPSAPLAIRWNNSENHDAQYYMYRHFAEIQDLRTNDTREFEIVWNSEVISDPITPLHLKVTTILSTSPRTCDGGQCSFQLIRTNISTLPPILNAFEVFKVIQFPQSETNENDVVAIKNIEATYHLSRINWQGDPCVPQQLRWEGLNCNNTVLSTPPRITSLNLSSSGLTGTIAAAIQNLTELETLDLSNNSLTGEVPEFLGNMESLMVINLSGNDLNGSIPQFPQKKGLELFLQGNPRLGPPKKRKSILVPVVVSVGSATILVIVLILYLVLRKKKSSYVKVVHPPQSTPNVNVSST